MATDTQAMTLLIRLMPLMQREFSLRVDPSSFFSDSGYRDAILGSALGAAEPRLRGYAEQLRARLAELGKGSPGALRSTANSIASYEKTSPGTLAGPLPGAAAPAPAPDAAPPDPESPSPNAARKYIGRLR